MVSDPSIRLERYLHLAAADLLAHRDRLRHRAVRKAPTAEVVDRADARILVERCDRTDEVGAVDVVADLLAAVAEDPVRRAGHRAAHQVREEAVELGARVMWAGQASAPKADRRNTEIAPVLLDQQVGGRLGDA